MNLCHQNCRNSVKTIFEEEAYFMGLLFIPSIDNILHIKLFDYLTNIFVAAEARRTLKLFGITGNIPYHFFGIVNALMLKITDSLRIVKHTC